MEKRGQITIFVVLGVFILVLFGLAFYVITYSTEEETSESAGKTSESTLDMTPVKKYAERCLEDMTENVLFDKIGPQGGYTNLSGVYYKDFGGVYGNGSYYLVGTNEYKPELAEIEENIEKHINADLSTCFNLNTFEEIGYNLTLEGNLSSNVSINFDDVSIFAKYPLTIKKDNSRTKIDDFSVSLPIRLNFTYSIVSRLVEDIKINGQDINNPYNLSLNCDKYNASFDPDPEVLIKINRTERIPGANDDVLIRILDYDTYLYDIFVGHYHKAFIFQFAVENLYVDGECYW